MSQSLCCFLFATTDAGSLWGEDEDSVCHSPGSAWIFNPQTGVFWSFDDPDSLSVKMDYVRRMQLGGVMFWELSGDDENSSLLKAIYRGLRQ